jgi:hypothetical protein
MFISILYAPMGNSFALFRRITKKGPPMRVVKIPTGISKSVIVRDKVSTTRRKEPPNANETGMALVLSGPTMIRTMCGTARPTMPIIPETATEAEAMSVAGMRSNNFSRLGSRPTTLVSSSPRATTFIRHRIMKSHTQPATINGAADLTFIQLALWRLPMVQCMMLWSLKGSEKNWRIVSSAVKTADTMTPARIRETVEISLFFTARK